MWEADEEGSSTTDVRFEPQFAFQPFHNGGVDQRQTLSRAFADGLSREERFKDTGTDFRCYSRARVGDADFDRIRQKHLVAIVIFRFPEVPSPITPAMAWAAFTIRLSMAG